VTPTKGGEEMAPGEVSRIGEREFLRKHASAWFLKRAVFPLPSLHPS